MIKRLVDDDDIIIYKWVYSRIKSNYMKQKLTELTGEIISSTIMLGNVNTPLSVIERIDGKSIRILQT